MLYATNRLIDSVWTVGYTMQEDGRVFIHSYDRDNPIGYEQEGKLPQALLDESAGRIVTGIQLRPYKSFDRNFKDVPVIEVANPQHVFSYSR